MAAGDVAFSGVTRGPSPYGLPPLPRQQRIPLAPISQAGGPVPLATPLARPGDDIRQNKANAQQLHGVANDLFNQWYAKQTPEQLQPFQGEPIKSGVGISLQKEGGPRVSVTSTDAENAAVMAETTRANARAHFNANVLPSHPDYQTAVAAQRPAVTGRVPTYPNGQPMTPKDQLTSAQVDRTKAQTAAIQQGKPPPAPRVPNRPGIAETIGKTVVGLGQAASKFGSSALNTAERARHDQVVETNAADRTKQLGAKTADPLNAAVKNPEYKQAVKDYAHSLTPAGRNEFLIRAAQDPTLKMPERPDPNDYVPGGRKAGGTGATESATQPAAAAPAANADGSLKGSPATSTQPFNSAPPLNPAAASVLNMKPRDMSAPASTAPGSSGVGAAAPKPVGGLQNDARWTQNDDGNYTHPDRPGMTFQDTGTSLRAVTQ